MTESFSIKSNASDRELKFFEPEGSDYFKVKLSGSVCAEMRVYAYSPHQQSLNLWFENIGIQTQPWNKELRWKSLEGEFIISALCSSMGSVFFEVSLFIARLTDEETTIHTSIVTELGQLNKIANDASKFFK